jgi:probable HAF family extracellular repeat protein
MIHMTVQTYWARAVRALKLPALVAGVLVLAPVHAATYQLTDLGVGVSPTDINNLGTIVGSRKTAAGNVAFRRLSGGALQDIPDATIANAINDSEQVTGNTPTGAFLLDGALMTWDGYGGYGINASGQISGYRQLDNPYRPSPLPLDPAIYTPNRWNNPGVATVYPRGTQQGVYADLYVLNAINNYGYAVGKRSRYGLSGSSAILTEPAFTTVIYLPIPNGGYAAAINDNNLVVGATGSNSMSGAYSHAYLYDYNAGSLLDLGTLSGGLTSSAADINNTNQVVGSSWLVTELTSVNDPTQYHAFLWENNVMTDLNDELPAGSGWILTAAAAINDNGDIVGTGLLNGQVHGFLLTAGGAQLPAPGQPRIEPPVAMASADVTSGRAPLSVNFTASGSYDPDGGSITGYVWDFGDGSAPVPGSDASHLYAAAGSFLAVLTVTDDQGLTATAQVQITVRKGKGRK